MLNDNKSAINRLKSAPGGSLSAAMGSGLVEKATPRAASGAKAPIANVDKRTFRRKNMESFVSAITEWREKTRAAPQPAVAGTGWLRAIVRKRPLFEHEQAKREFDVVTVRGNDVIMHSCQMHTNAESMLMQNTAFKRVAEVFDDDCGNEALCGERGIAPLVGNVMGGGSSTIFMFGQTGSGKTHTMTGIEQYVADVLVPEPTAAAPIAGHLTFFEVTGSKCFELLGDAPGRELTLMQDADGKVTPMGVARVPVTSGAQLLELIAFAKSRRATSSTAANATSSRSHAVCQLERLASPHDVSDAAAAGELAAPPVLTLVDCAGTERKEDSIAHDAAQRKEGAEINSSLMALKECMRIMAAAGKDGKQRAHVPFRESGLTRVLAESFLRADTQLAVIGTLSPVAADTEHTIETLRTIAVAAGAEANVATDAKKDVPRAQDPAEIVPAKWGARRLREWLETAVARMPQGGGKVPLAKALPKVPASVDGKVAMSMTVMKMKNVWGLDEPLANALYAELRVATKAAEEATKKAKKRT